MDLKDRLSAALVGRYEIVDEIGRGGMAVVYLARDLKLQRRVAIKVLRPEFSASLIADRFVQEIQIAARLEHPLILALYESDSSDGLLWYAMPYVEGETLYDRLKGEKQLPVDEAVRITCEVAEALSYAHGQGVVHRDIKPANILFSDGHPLVADFGIAKAFTEAGGPTHTATAVGIGTPGYMSPEQATGEKNIDPRTDVYSLACVLYEMLAGETPYTGPTAQAIIAKQLSLPVPSVCTVRDTVPFALDDALRKALAKVPADRFPSVGDFAQALRVAQQSNRPSRLVVRRRFAIGGAVTLAAAIAAVFARPNFGFDNSLLDPRRVVVFPLVDRRGAGTAEGAGEEVALMIGHALEHTEPLRWIDGWDWVDSTVRAGRAGLSVERAREITRARGAGHLIDGWIVSEADSEFVILRLHTAAGDTVIAREGAGASIGKVSLPELGRRAVSRLLPILIDPSHRSSGDPLASSAPAAVANWLQGERLYRQSNFVPALEHFRRAVALDSSFVLAAVRGAQAASWKSRPAEAVSLIGAAIRQDSLLPSRWSDLAWSLRYFMTGDADSAVGRLNHALELDAEWSEAWMALGEVHYHLLPAGGGHEPLAQEAFRKARQFDPGFAPALVHLIEIAMRQHAEGWAQRLTEEFQYSNPDSALAGHLGLMVRCATSGPERTAWERAETGSLLVTLEAATQLGPGVAFPECARAAYHAVLATRNATVSERWAALLGLHGLLLAAGRYDDLERLLASHSDLPVDLLRLLDGVAEPALLDRARAAAARYWTEASTMSSVRLWALAGFEVQTGNQTGVARLVRLLEERARSSGSSADSLLAEASRARLLLVRGDTAAAIARLRRLRPMATATDLAWGVWESLGAERLLLARLLLSQRDYSQASAVAAELEHPQPVIFNIYLPASLDVRAQAAAGLGMTRVAESYQSRLSSIREQWPSPLTQQRRKQ